jgi:hypothetical protein
LAFVLGGIGRPVVSIFKVVTQDVVDVRRGKKNFYSARVIDFSYF